MAFRVGQNWQEKSLCCYGSFYTHDPEQLHCRVQFHDFGKSKMSGVMQPILSNSERALEPTSCGPET